MTVTSRRVAAARRAKSRLAQLFASCEWFLGVGIVPEGFGLLSDDVAVYYVSQEQGASQIELMEIDAQGRFVNPWPDDFFEIDFYERFDDAR